MDHIRNIVVLPIIEWFLQVLIGPSRYCNESPIFDKLKYQERYLEPLFVLIVHLFLYSSSRGRLEQVASLNLG